MEEQYSNISHHNETDHQTGMDEPDSEFVINKNFKGFRKKFKGVNIETGNLDSPISSQQSDGDLWGDLGFDPPPAAGAAPVQEEKKEGDEDAASYMKTAVKKNHPPMLTRIKWAQTVANIKGNI